MLHVIRGKPFTLAVLRCQTRTSIHAVGGVGIHGEQGAPFACCSETYYPAWCPPPSPIHPCHPHKTLQLHPTILSLSFFSSLSEVCIAEQWVFYAQETWNVSECSRLGPSFCQSMLCVPCFPWEKLTQWGHRLHERRMRGNRDVLTVTAEVLKRFFFRVEGVGESLRTEGRQKGNNKLDITRCSTWRLTEIFNLQWRKTANLHTKWPVKKKHLWSFCVHYLTKLPVVQFSAHFLIH